VFLTLATIFNGSYALIASSLRHVVARGPVLPFVQRYVAGSVFIVLGVLAATASAGRQPVAVNAAR
jgi:threonine/homoserine/homoserine lactone efflux protein